jgi:excisionase family DNA binding protein
MPDNTAIDSSSAASEQPAADAMGRDGLFSATDAAASLGVNERTIRRAIARGELTATKRGRSFAITLESLERYRARQDRSSGRRVAPSAESRLPAPAAPRPLFALPLKEQASLTSLPAPLTRFIGREREIAAVGDRLCRDDARLVTLTGPGGVGKTRLSLRVAEEVADRFAAGVVFVSLAPVPRPDLVLPAVARALGVRESSDHPLAASLVAALRDRRLLLVLDNLEHLLDAATDLVDLLAACPKLTILVTSRTSLRLSIEQRIPTPPLALPDAGEAGLLDKLQEYEAIALFIERAQQACPGFALASDNAAEVLEICRRLDGLPLALELAAAWLRVLSPADLLARMDRRLALLTGGPTDQPSRLRTMRDAIAWSHDLLSNDERRLFRRLAVFVGDFTLDGAKQIWAVDAKPMEADDGSRFLHLLAGLIDKSLLHRTDAAAAQPRYAMLETIREFGLEQLVQRRELASVQTAHAAHYLALAEEAASSAGGAGGGEWLHRLAADGSNLRTALDWLEQTGQADATLRMTSALWHYWYRHGDLAEGRDRLERALAAAPPEVTPVVRARALRGAGVLAWQSADYDWSRQRLEDALAAYGAVGDLTGTAWVLNSLGCLFATLSEAEQAEAHFGDALAIFRQLGDAVGIAQLTANLGELAEVEGRHELAIERLDTALAKWRDLDDRVGAARAQVYLGQALLARNKVARAETVLREALIAIRDIEYEQLLPAALRSIAQLAARRSDFTVAARWYGAEAGVREALGMKLPAARRAGHEGTIAAVREALGEAAFASAWEEGQSDPSGALAVLVNQGDVVDAADRVADDGRGGISGLTARERDVLRLVAQGRTDREIADALYVTRRTASKHVSAILAKLGVQSRAAAAAFAARRGLA